MSKINRRRFLKQTAAIAFPAVLTQKSEAAKAPASERVRVGMVGAAGRAGSLNRIFAKNKNAEIVGIAEIDPRRLPGTLESVTKTQGSKPRAALFFEFNALSKRTYQFGDQCTDKAEERPAGRSRRRYR